MGAMFGFYKNIRHFPRLFRRCEQLHWKMNIQGNVNFYYFMPLNSFINKPTFLFQGIPLFLLCYCLFSTSITATFVASRISPIISSRTSDMLLESQGGKGSLIQFPKLFARSKARTSCLFIGVNQGGILETISQKYGGQIGFVN